MVWDYVLLLSRMIYILARDSSLFGALSLDIL